ncbi:TrbI/VirB10 family protein (plasmid) [Roseomonas sp. CCTCC AB2023176]|uniref:TrbI/VirB10 family protein n=1 Tax=Roseomonas sp. CCTCC AB2023176 TaxID=3342640 RepID=UPI0035DFD865
MSGAAAPPPAPVPPAGVPTVPGERHVSEVAGRSPALGRKAGVGAIIAAGALACGVVLLTASPPDLRPPPGPELAVRPTIRFEPPPPAPPAQSVSLPLAPPPPLATPPQQPAAAAAAPARPSQPRLLVFNAGGGTGAGGATRTAGGSTAGEGMPALPPGAHAPDPAGAGSGPVRLSGTAGGAGLADRLRPTPLAGVTASVLRNQPYLLTTGTLIPCVLQTAMDSTLPGLVTCVVPQDVLGKTGLVLLDRGTRVVGQHQGDVRQGVERMFVLWTRAETPQGVVIALDSPASDALGRSGLEGEVDRRFWQRFGGALLLSVVQGGLQAGTAAVSREGGISINTGQTGAVVAEALRGSGGLPPTIRKAQGELVSIFVARDLDFSTVYGVVPTSPEGHVR